MPQQLLLKNASLFPLNPVPPEADALLIQDGHIVAMGSAAELAERASPQVAIIDLTGKTVLPGFIDTHVHLAETGLLAQEIDLSSAESIAQVIDLLAEAFARRFSSQIFQAHSLDPSQLAERRYPTMEELDGISAQVPIFVLRRDGHSCAVNSAYYRLAGLTDRVPGVEVDPQTGRPSGTLRAQALEQARRYRVQIGGGENRMEAILRTCWQAVRKGVTTVHAICAREADLDLLSQLADGLPVDLVPYLGTTEIDVVLKRGLRQIGGDLLVDGSLGSHTAALFEPYADRPDERGLLYFRRQKLVAFVREAHQAGLQVAMHAIGDRAVEQVLSAYEAALDQHPRENHRHRIDHAELLSCEQIHRMRQRGITLAVQPAFEAFWGGPGGMYARRLGPGRAQRTNPFRSLMEAGVIIAGGSDSYVTPVDPLAGIAAAVNHPTPEQRISVVEAVRMFTANGAYLGFQEREKGELETGMRADLVVLCEDPRLVSARDIADIKIHMVIKGGRVMVAPQMER
jgi:predicted amidohydrolase YtcJ